MKTRFSNVSQQIAVELTTFLSARLKPDAKVCVALSGGRDSVVLLHALRLFVGSATIPVSLSALHVHHGISPNAEAWAGFCEQLCRQLDVPLSVVRVNVPRDSGEGLEAAARRMRHAVFADCAADWLALAHHRDDQAETVLLNLLRGAGVAGAAGMLAERSQPSGPVIIRPLLDVPRSALEHYAAEHGLRWIEDESNDDLHYRRNFLRRDVLPRLEEKFPGAQKSLTRAAGHFAEGAMLLDDLAAIDHAALITQAGRIDLTGFNALSPARARNLLRFAWIAAGFRAPDTRWVEEALRQMANTDALSETCLSTSDGELHIYRGEVHIVGHSPSLPEDLLWAGETELPWADGRVRFMPVSGSGIRRSLLDIDDVILKPRHGGERLRPDAKRPRRSLRKLLQEKAIPPWERACLPFLWVGGQLAWVGGLGVESVFVCEPGEEGVLPVWER